MGRIFADAASQVKAPLPDSLEERSFRVHGAIGEDPPNPR